MQCRHCNANMWYNERISKHKNSSSPRFNLCCGDGKVKLPLLQNPPKHLQQLLFDHHAADSKNYQQNIWTYNMMFAFTSAGIKLDKSINDSRGPPTIRIQGQPCHRIGSLLPMPEKEPKFAQLYIFGTDNEVQNRINAISHHNEIEAHIVSSLSQMLDEHNTHAKSFRMIRDRLAHSEVHNVRLKLIANREKDARTYNVPTISEVATLIAGDFYMNSKRNIILETQNGQLQRIHELHSSYLGLQYPLLFPYGEDRYRADILHRATSSGQKRKRNHLTMREWFAFKLQCRSNEAQTFLHSRKLFQQFVVEGYIMVESERLSFIRNNQKKLRVDKFCSLQNSLDAGTTKGLNRGKRVILPLTFVGSPRYMDQLYFDGIAICSHVGFPNLFITLTCNPNWPEIHRLLTPLNLKATNRPDIILREDDPELYTLVQNHMVHGPCEILQTESPCMKEGRCICFYPKMFQSHTLLDEDDYLVYHRRNNGRTISKNGVTIYNKYIVPYNPKLLRKYQAHINIEWCNQSTSVKYLFKYINKGYDRVTLVMVHDDNDAIHHATAQNDEIKEYLDCRKERLHFHLSGQHNFLYQDHDDIDDVLPTAGELFYLRMMLIVCKGLTTFEDIRTIANVQYPTYREACFVVGFLQDDREFVEAIKEAKDWGTTHYLRKLFVLILLTGTMNKLEEVWDQTWHWLADNIAYHHRKTTTNTEIHLNDDHLKILVLLEIEQLLQANQKSLRDYPSMPYLGDENWATSSIYNQIIQAVNKDEGGMFFLYGYGGTGKTFIWKTLASSLRADNKIFIMVTSSGIASLLLPRGRTTHSKFKILIPIFEDSTCNIHQGSQLVELLNQTSLIIWDEAPMAHKICFEALDQSLRDIIKGESSSNKIFGGKVMVFGGDFRQILPIIPRGSCFNIVNATINSSYLWDYCHTATFAQWILDIGDGIIGHQNDGYAIVEIPQDLLITEYDDPIHGIVNSTFLDLCQHHNNPEFFQSRAILASTNETIQQVNDYILSLIPGEHMEYLNQTQGLCNGTRLIVTMLAKHVISAEIISGKNVGHNVYIMRMSMSPSQSPWP
uniref:ATP-dependent DNA helicase n=1 Tax=Glycine max TaxID=3847 RepID=A0A0R0KGC4_SOYBN